MGRAPTAAGRLASGDAPPSISAPRSSPSTVLERLARTPHRPALVVTRPGSSARARPQAVAAAGRRGGERARHRGLPARGRQRRRVARPDRGGRAERRLHLRLRRADQASRCCPSTRCSTCTRRCCRAGAARRRSSGRSRQATRRPASRSCARSPSWTPVRCACSAASRSAPTTTTHRSRRGSPNSSAELLLEALDEDCPWREQPEDGITYAEKIDREDRRARPVARRGRARAPRARAESARRARSSSSRTASASACAARRWRAASEESRTAATRAGSPRSTPLRPSRRPSRASCGRTRPAPARHRPWRPGAARGAAARRQADGRRGVPARPREQGVKDDRIPLTRPAGRP